MSRGNVLFIFRRDLRIKDNRGLALAVQQCKGHKDRKLVLAFVFSKDQIDQSPYYSEPAFRFMLECLEELDGKVDGKLAFFDDEDFYQSLDGIDTIVYNADYTPYAEHRDRRIREYCESKEGLECVEVEDYTLHPIDAVKTKEGEAYQVFGYFHKAARRVERLESTEQKLARSRLLDGLGDKRLLKKRLEAVSSHAGSSALLTGGRARALKRLKSVTKPFGAAYDEARDFPEREHTTMLSPYIKFGCVSVREVRDAFERIGANDLVKQLYWREFYANVAHHYPHVLGGMVGERNLEMYEKFRGMAWNENEKEFVRWCEGNTGVPLVDAGMRQLNTTGYMHNRVRMVTASFLVKNLGIDWRWGERYFATKLVDYDPASNNGGWQWVAGTGTDAAPYFRVFNPFSQAERFDKECEYVLKHVEELRDVDVEDILNWDKAHKKDKYAGHAYPAPMVDLKKSAEAFKKKMKRL